MRVIELTDDSKSAHLIEYGLSNQSYVKRECFKVDPDVYECAAKKIKDQGLKLLVVALRSGSGYIYSVSANGDVLATRDSVTYSPKDIFIELLEEV